MNTMWPTRRWAIAVHDLAPPKFSKSAQQAAARARLPICPTGSDISQLAFAVWYATDWVTCQAAKRSQPSTTNAPLTSRD